MVLPIPVFRLYGKKNVSNHRPLSILLSLFKAIVQLISSLLFKTFACLNDWIESWPYKNKRLARWKFFHIQFFHIYALARNQFQCFKLIRFLINFCLSHNHYQFLTRSVLNTPDLQIIWGWCQSGAGLCHLLNILVPYYKPYHRYISPFCKYFVTQVCSCLQPPGFALLMLSILWYIQILKKHMFNHKLSDLCSMRVMT